MAAKLDLSSIYKLVPLTDDYAHQFSALMREQGDELDASAGDDQPKVNQKLVDAIVREKQCESFLVVRKSDNKAMVAITHYPCLTENGRLGLYLEDIVTTKTERGKGAGTFAMIGLAQLASHFGAESISWECSSIAPAQQFYDKIEAGLHTDKQTWRHMGLPKHQGQDALFKPRYNVVLDKRVGTDDNLIALRVENLDGDIVGRVKASRSFSTFRVEAGLHIEHIDIPGKKPLILAGVIEHLVGFQKRAGWHGHTDITVSEDNKEYLAPVLEGYKFGPLTYNAPMTQRFLKPPQLTELANRTDNVIGALVDMPAETQQRNSLARRVSSMFARVL